MKDINFISNIFLVSWFTDPLTQFSGKLKKKMIWCFHMGISCDEIFPLVPTIWQCDLELGVWPFSLYINLPNNFWTESARAMIFHLNIPRDKTFRWVKKASVITTFNSLDSSRKQNSMTIRLWNILAKNTIQELCR